MALPQPSSEFPSGEWTTNAPISDCRSADDLGCLDTSSNTFTRDFCNIRGLRSNFKFVKYHLSSTKPHLFLNETQLSVNTDSSPFSVPSYFLYPHFQSKAGCCAYVRNDVTCSYPQSWIFRIFFTIWLRLQCHSLTKFICAVFFSPNSSDNVILWLFDFRSGVYPISLSLCWDLHFRGFQGISMFTTSLGFHLLSLINLGNKPSTLLSFMT